MPSYIGYDLLMRLGGKNEYYYDRISGMMIVKCSEKNLYQDINIWIDGYKFEILVDDYFITSENFFGGESAAQDDVCILALVDDYQFSYWLLGDAFLKGYYSIHDNNDHSKARIGFAPHSNSKKNKVIRSQVNKDNAVEDHIWEVNWIGIGGNIGWYNPRRWIAKIWNLIFGAYPVFI